MAHISDGALYLVSMHDRHRRVHLREEEVGAGLDELMGQEAGSSGIKRG